MQLMDMMQQIASGVFFILKRSIDHSFDFPQIIDQHPEHLFGEILFIGGLAQRDRPINNGLFCWR
ncbi:Uncharacterised protein [Vibrio cholerae]|nr:Uncharacterised protein [Vibrio cholerae]CSI36327.1 Uncharacterised protein [Vibrio cholerae]